MEKAKKIIPGGNMILSKNPERFLPDYWPTYFKKAKGCKIIDLDGNEYLDFSLMGVGTNVLGYANKHIDNQVKKTIFEGNMSTLNSKEEVLLAEKLIEIHPWFNKVKFARTGGEANAIAIESLELRQEKITLPSAVTMDGMIGICRLIYLQKKQKTLTSIY